MSGLFVCLFVCFLSLDIKSSVNEKWSIDYCGKYNNLKSRQLPQQQLLLDFKLDLIPKVSAFMKCTRMHS